MNLAIAAMKEHGFDFKRPTPKASDTPLPVEADHVHEWKKYKQRDGMSTYFVVRGCEVCHEKEYIDLRRY